MRVIDTLMLVGALIGMFVLGIGFESIKIQSTCESDDRPTVINGTPYVCLSPRHMEMLKRQQQSWRGT